jgi:chaperonin GroEL
VPWISDRTQGESLLIKAITEPARQIIRNAGHAAPVVNDVIAKVYGAHNDEGFDAATGEYCKLLVEGIVDPAKVVLTALRKAASIGALLLTTEVLCSDIPERQEVPQRPQAMGV